jgi:hypothetical protein
MFGKMNWANLPNYSVQPSDMELFQTYVNDRLLQFLAGSRTSGLVSGGEISLVAGLQFKVSAGFAIMPDGTLVSWPELTGTLPSANASFSRYDRIELA